MSASPKRWVVVGAADAAIFMAMLDASIVNVALPTIGADLGVGPDQAQWVVLAYLLAVASIVLPTGRWLDTVGRRSALMFGVGGFAVSSAVAAAAPSFAWLIGARVAEGAFGAVILALVPVVVAGAVSACERGRAIGIVATVGPLGSVARPSGVCSPPASAGRRSSSSTCRSARCCWSSRWRVCRATSACGRRAGSRLRRARCWAAPCSR
jgi:MFS family permease